MNGARGGLGLYVSAISWFGNFEFGLGLSADELLYFDSAINILILDSILHNTLYCSLWISLVFLGFFSV